MTPLVVLVAPAIGDVVTVTLVGDMTRSCILGSTAEPNTRGLAAEVLSDATGALAPSNAAGSIDAETVHTTRLAHLHSNFAAVRTTRARFDALDARTTPQTSDLVIRPSPTPSSSLAQPAPMAWRRPAVPPAGEVPRGNRPLPSESTVIGTTPKRGVRRHRSGHDGELPHGGEQ